MTKLLVYALLLMVQRVFLRPRSAVNDLRLARSAFNQAGLKGLQRFLVGEFLPRRYLLKTRVATRRASYSIIPKIFRSVRDSKALLEPFLTHDQMEKILIIRSGAMGDVILTTPVIRRLYESRGGLCHIDVATRYPEVFNNNPRVHGVIEIGELKSLDRHYDLIIDLDMSQEKHKSIHPTEAYFRRVFGNIDLSSLNLQSELFWSDDDIREVETIIEKFPDGYVVTHNRGDLSQPYRNIDENTWKQFLTDLENYNLPILQIGSTDIDVFIETDSSIDLRGKMDLQQTAYLLSRAKLFVGGDAGPLHIAASNNVPIIGFFSIAHHDSRKPLRKNDDNFVAIAPSLECYGCAQKYPLPWGFACARGDSICQKSYPVEQAISAVPRFLSS